MKHLLFTIALALALWAGAPSAARADFVYVSHNECRPAAHGMYEKLASFHLYAYEAQVYRQLARANPRLAPVYLALSAMFGSLSNVFYSQYWMQYAAFIKCEYKPLVYTNTVTSTATMTVANGAVLTVTRVSVQTATSTGGNWQ